MPEDISSVNSENPLDDASSSFAQNKEAVDDSYVRLLAEFSNFRKRSSKQLNDLTEQVESSTVRSFLALYDDFQLAEKHGELSPGFKSVFDSYRKIITNFGCSPFGDVGDRFNPDLHEAVGSESGVPADVVSQVLSVGFMLNGKVVRFAKVYVGVDDE
jgi:molecular chaperone GrpE